MTAVVALAAASGALTGTWLVVAAGTREVHEGRHRMTHATRRWARRAHLHRLDPHMCLQLRPRH